MRCVRRLHTTGRLRAIQCSVVRCLEGDRRPTATRLAAFLRGADTRRYQHLSLYALDQAHRAIRRVPRVLGSLLRSHQPHIHNAVRRAFPESEYTRIVLGSHRHRANHAE